ncbi:Transcriptional regulator PadR-like family protein [Nonomuraea coxensis DSM 45129]|uniref:Transcriptional regulator PadR-like family protein n=1 Tax=Nonomuraea coxensis DSM 45129 TaxID=1122611 RepID=A0ABX8TZ76_9ACTN|nr:PadR family transcriptional regulator [Nonomuraea coxensis]QYC40795.1 Transcriptional regulator PadR-like family protein [Nonomuraea coxensis DSM 45129]
MLELAILGFLRDHPLHGYELRKRVAALMGRGRPVADGTLYPAIKRLAAAGWVTRKDEPGAAAAPRRVLHLTEEGREELDRRLREPADLDISDGNRWSTLLAFLRHLDEPGAQAAVLRRRRAFLEERAGLLGDGDRPAEDVADPFRRGLLVVAQAAGQAELAWLTQTVAELERTPHPAAG